MKNLPSKSGWFWIFTIYDDSPIPCWYMEDCECFLPAGLGDSSRNGIYINDIEKIGPEIIEPD